MAQKMQLRMEGTLCQTSFGSTNGSHKFENDCTSRNDRWRAISCPFVAESVIMSVHDPEAAASVLSSKVTAMDLQSEAHVIYGDLVSTKLLCPSGLCMS